jgi:hypothetical protein
MTMASVGASKETEAADSGDVAAAMTPISSVALACGSAADVFALTESSEVSGISAGASGARATAVAVPALNALGELLRASAMTGSALAITVFTAEGVELEVSAADSLAADSTDAVE